MLLADRIGCSQQVRQIVERVVPFLPLGLPRRIGCDQLLLPHLQHLLDHHRGNRVSPVARPNQHRLRDCERKREVDGESGPLAAREAHLNATAERRHFALHHVHADTAPRDLGHLGGGGEARVENEIGYLRLRQRHARSDEAFLDGLLPDPVDVQAPAVIRQRELHFVAFLRELQADQGIAYLFISHDLAVVRSLSHRVGVLYLGEPCEVGTAEQVYAPPYHPYTHMLLSAVPEIDGENVVSSAVRTDPGLASSRPASACPFADRCPWKVGPICDEVEPPWREAGGGHALRCHIPLDDLTRRAAESGVRVGSLAAGDGLSA